MQQPTGEEGRGCRGVGSAPGGAAAYRGEGQGRGVGSAPGAAAYKGGGGGQRRGERSW